MLFAKHTGQNLIEAIIAIGLFGILIGSGAMATLRYFDSQIRATSQLNLAELSTNTFEILEGLAKTNWDALTVGTHGLILNGNNWEISDTPDLVNQTTRSINISNGLRDGACNLVSVGGSADPDTKIVLLTLSYNDNRGPQTKSFTQNLTRWNNPTNCVVITEAGSLQLDVSTAFIDSTKKSLFGIYLRNLGNTIITLDKMTFTWNTGGHITYVKISGANYWHATNGIGTPSGSQPSGTELNLVNFVLQPQTSYEIDNVRFDTKVDGATFTIKATMLDNSSKTEFTTPPFIP